MRLSDFGMRMILDNCLRRNAIRISGHKESWAGAVILVPKSYTDI